MSISSPSKDSPTILIVGASRGLGLAIATEFARREWKVIGTVRSGRTLMHDLAGSSEGRVEVAMLDVEHPEEVVALRTRLTDRRIDVLFVSAGTTTSDEHAEVEDVDADEFARVMRINALGPMRVIGALQDLVPADGLIGVMSSGQGSIANNEAGGRETYRASKAALNQLMRSFAAREDQASRRIVLLAPGWVRTDLGGSDGTYSVEETSPLLVDLLLARRQQPGLAYLDRFGRTVAW